MSNSIREKQIGNCLLTNKCIVFDKRKQQIYNRLKDLLKCMLNFNQAHTVSSGSTSNINGLLNEPSWKVLIYDDYGLDIISPLLNVKELRDLGVTAHL